MSTLPKKQETQLPNSFECEQALLGTVMSYPKTLTACVDLLPEDFFEGLHSRIFATLLAQVNLTGSASPLAVMSQLRGDETLSSMGVEPSRYVAALVANQQPVGSVVHLARVIKNDSMLRSIALKADEMARQALSPEIGETAVDVAARAIDELSGIVSSGNSDNRQTVFSTGETLNAITDSVNNYFTDGELPAAGAYCGTQAINRVFNGWKRGKYYVLAGRPGMAKTTVAVSLLMRTAGKGSNVLFFSLEMGAEELGYRMLSDIAYQSSDRVEYQSLERREVSQGQFERILDAAEKIKSIPLTIVDKAGLTLAQVKALSLKEKQRLEANGKTLDVICIDHMGLMRASDRYKGNKVAETEEISNQLKVLSKDLDVAVVALSQLSRGTEARDDKRPTLSDLRWSGSIEQDADVVMFVYRPEYYLERQKCDDPIKENERLNALDGVKNKLEIIVAKHRGGACPNIEMFLDIGCAALRDIAQ